MILVTGATGNIGREVVNLLLSSGKQVVAVTRNPAIAALPDGAHVVESDPSHPQTLTKVLSGVEAVFLSPRALGDATAGTATAELLKLAAEQGTQRVVVVSADTVEYGGGEKRFSDAFRRVEDAARASGLQWTILRCSDFAVNSLVWVPQIRQSSVVRGDRPPPTARRSRPPPRLPSGWSGAHAEHTGRRWRYPAPGWSGPPHGHPLARALAASPRTIGRLSSTAQSSTESHRHHKMIRGDS